MDIIDTHAHLNLEEFGDDCEAAIERAHEAGVTQIICVGTSAATSHDAMHIATHHAGVVHSTVGIHPNYAMEAHPADWDEVNMLAHEPEVVGIGETGIDYYREHTPPEIQKAFFRRHLEIAAKYDKPVIVHARKARGDVEEVFRDFVGDVTGVRHCFSGSAEEVEWWVERGFYISFAGNVTRKNQKRLREAAAAVPADRILVETDSPYLTPAGVDSRRNEPAFVVHTLRAVSEARGVDQEDLAEQTTANAKRLFRLE